MQSNYSPLPTHGVILGKKCLVFQRKTLAFFDRGSHCPRDPRPRKGKPPLILGGKVLDNNIGGGNLFLLRMTRVGE
ncbi:MAG: hypothetical protein BGO67_05895 [Alphaproteobacteria bacterium 41-28]|nr:MAG: hypothetical protein BGO67_05895 [Alphaproteobacteria bacterium 41-28]